MVPGSWPHPPLQEQVQIMANRAATPHTTNFSPYSTKRLHLHITFIKLRYLSREIFHNAVKHLFITSAQTKSRSVETNEKYDLIYIVCVEGGSNRSCSCSLFCRE